MVIDYEGKTYILSMEEMTVRQACTIFRRSGFTVDALDKALAGEERYEAFEVLFWLMKEQAGEHGDISRVDCKLFPFMRAYHKSLIEEKQIHEAAERIENDGLTDAEWFASLPPGQSFTHSETQARKRIWQEASQFKEVWYTKDVPRLRAQYLWDFGEILKFSGTVIDNMRVVDFFSYCNCLKAHRENQKKKQEAKAKQRAEQGY